MSCTIKQDLCLQQGASKTFLVTVLDDNGDPVDLTGGALYFTVRQNITDTNPVILKTSADILEIEILAQVAPTIGQAKIYIVPSDTSGLSTANPYIYDLWVELASGNSYPVIAPSCLIIEPSVTNINAPGSPPSIVSPITVAEYIYQPGGTGTGPVVYSDWNALETAKEANRALSGGDFNAVVRIDDSITTPAVIPANGANPAYNFTNVLLEGSDFRTTTRLDFADGASIIGLRRVGRNIGIRSLTTGELETLSLTGAAANILIGTNSYVNQAGTGSFWGGSGLTAGDFIFLVLSEFGSINFAFGAGSGTGAVVDMSTTGTFILVAATQESSIPTTGIEGVAGSLYFLSYPSTHVLPDDLASSFSGTIIVPAEQATPPGLSPNPIAYTAASAASVGTGVRPGQWVRLNASGGAIAQPAPAVSSFASDYKSPGVLFSVYETSGTEGVTLTPQAGDTINGGSTALRVPGGGGALLMCDGVSDWEAVGIYDPSSVSRLMDASLVTGTPDSLSQSRVARYDTTASNIVANLPAASAVPLGQSIIVKNEAGSNQVTVTPNGVDTIDGAAGTSAVTAGASAEYISDGTSNWTVI